MAERVFLSISAAIWGGYGLFCLAVPGYLSEAAGVAHLTPTGSTELRAMYGGLQAAIGLLALCAVLRPNLRRTALINLAFMCGGLAIARTIGVVLDGDITAYTIFGLSWETGSTIVATLLLRNSSEAVPA